MERSILFIGAMPEPSVLVKVRLAGIKRYAETIGCKIEVIKKSDASPSFVRTAIRNSCPVGCIVDCSGYIKMDLEPSVFGRIPVVYTDCSPDAFSTPICCLTVDDDGVADTAFRELSTGRPSALAVVKLTERHKWSEARASGFTTRAESSGLHLFKFETPGVGIPGAEDSDLKAWCASLPKRTAIFAVNDPVAFRVAEAVKATGRSIPRDIRILGVDNVEERYKMPCRLSSVAIDFEHFGWLAARMLFDVVAGRIKAPASMKLLPRFVVRRASTRNLSRVEPFVEEAMEIIRRDACAGLTVASLAAHFKCSRSLFDLRFREMCGHSPYDEILRIRLDRADTLLCHTNKPIGTIASFCGFNSEIALRRLFRRRTGMSMQQWRRSHSS